MKKVAIGCGVVAALLMLALGIGSYFLYSSAKKYISGYAELAEQIPALNDQIRNTSAYRPPADGRLTAVQVERYIGIQQSILNELGARFRRLEAKYDQLTRNLEDQGREPNIRQLLDAWTDVVSLVVDAKAAQVKALNEAGYSLGEYYWIRQQVLMSLGYGAFAWNLEALADDPSKMLAPYSPADTASLDAMQHNRALLQEHEDTIENWLALSFFGL